MSSPIPSPCAQVLINFPPTTGAQPLCLSPPHLRHGKFGVHVLPTNRLLVQTKITCWNRRAESAGAWKGGRLPESLAVAYGGNGETLMPGCLPIVPKPSVALRPRSMRNSFLGRRDQRHGQRLLESACTNSYGTHPPSTPQHIEDKDPNCSEIGDTSSDNIISQSERTGLESGVLSLAVTLAGQHIATVDSTEGSSIPRDNPGSAPSGLQKENSGFVSPRDGSTPGGQSGVVSVALGGQWSRLGGSVEGSPPSDPKRFDFKYLAGLVEFSERSDDGTPPRDPTRFRFRNLEGEIDFYDGPIDGSPPPDPKQLHFTFINGQVVFDNGPPSQSA